MKLPLTETKKSEVIASIQRFMSAEIDTEISDMQADILWDYFTRELAPFAYNKGIEDAQKFMLLKAEDLSGTCFEESLTYWTRPSRGARRKP